MPDNEARLISRMCKLGMDGGSVPRASLDWGAALCTYNGSHIPEQFGAQRCDRDGGKWEVVHTAYTSVNILRGKQAYKWIISLLFNQF